MNRSRPSLSRLARDRAAFALLAILLLMLTALHPLAEAKAAGNPAAGVICSAFGVAGEPVTPGAADDCPACTPCGGCLLPSSSCAASRCSPQPSGASHPVRPAEPTRGGAAAIAEHDSGPIRAPPAPFA